MNKSKRLKAVSIECAACKRTWGRERFEKGGLFTGPGTDSDAEVEGRMHQWVAGHRLATGHAATIEREEVPY